MQAVPAPGERHVHGAGRLELAALRQDRLDVSDLPAEEAEALVAPQLPVRRQTDEELPQEHLDVRPRDNDTLLLNPGEGRGRGLVHLIHLLDAATPRGSCSRTS